MTGKVHHSFRFQAWDGESLAQISAFWAAHILRHVHLITEASGCTCKRAMVIYASSCFNMCSDASGLSGIVLQFLHLSALFVTMSTQNFRALSSLRTGTTNFQLQTRAVDLASLKWLGLHKHHWKRLSFGNVSPLKPLFLPKPLSPFLPEKILPVHRTKSGSYLPPLSKPFFPSLPKPAMFSQSDGTAHTGSHAHLSLLTS